MQCSRCGATVANGRSRFCPACGHALAADPVGEAAVAQLIATAVPDVAGTLEPSLNATSRLATPPMTTQWRRWWWKILLIGTGVYLAVNGVLTATQNIFLLPQLFMIGTFLVPVVYIAYLYEDGTLYDVALSKIALIFFFGGVVGTLAASLLEARLITSNSEGFFGQLSFLNATIVSVSEELTKLIVLLPFLLVARGRYPTVMHGIVLGATAGMGFAAFESMGYAFAQLIQTQAVDAMHDIIRTRSLLAPLGHGTWTAIIAAALWREQISGRSVLNANVLIGFVLAVVLHFLWDYLPVVMIAGLPLLHLVLGVVGLLLLRFFMVVAKGGQGAAYQERNLAAALRLYAGDLRNQVRRKP